MTPSTNLSRRAVIAGGAGAVVVAGATGRASAATQQVFQHGVASGDPLPDAVVLWTRVSPTAASTPGSGTGPSVTVTWEVATDHRFRDVVRRGTTTTGPDRDHTVKVDATQLDADTAYFYRFTCRGQSSPVGRTTCSTTTPSQCCSSYSAGVALT